MDAEIADALRGESDWSSLNGEIVRGLVILVSLGAASQWLAWRLRVPSIIVLLLVGFIAGPVLGVIQPDLLLGEVTFPLVSLGAAMVLFEGGLTASWSDMKSVARPVRRLVTIGLITTWLTTTAAAYALLGMSLELSALLAAILVVTGPTVIGPLLRHARPRGAVGPVLKFEGILNDPIGAVLAVLVFQVIEAEQVQFAISAVAWGLAKAAVLSTAVGLLAAWGYVESRRRAILPRQLANAVLLALALGAYVAGNMLQHESGLLAVTVMGIALASQKRVNIEASLEFTEHARTMLISVLFILLTARMRLSDMTALPLGVLSFVLLLLFGVRPLAVWLATVRSGLQLRERAFLAAMAPRGIVAAAVSSLFALRLQNIGVEQAQLLMPVTFVVIAVTVTTYGLAAVPLVRVLGLAQRSPDGVLLLGANSIARAIAKALEKAERKVLLVDSDRHKVAKARRQGLNCVHGRLPSERVLDRLDLDDIGHFVALTSNVDTNRAALAHFRRHLGHDNVHHLAAPVGLRGRLEREARRQEVTRFEHLATLVRRGAVGSVTRITDDFTYADYLRAGSCLPLLLVDDAGGLRVISPVSPARSGDRVVGLELSRPLPESQPRDGSRAATG